jgi:ribosomal RNA-processing protein 17
VAAVAAALKQANGHESEQTGTEDEADGDEFVGFEDPVPVNREDEYIDEDKYTTVTVEEVGISRQGFVDPGGESETGEEEQGQKDSGSRTEHSKAKTKTSVSKPKKKRKKFRYEGREDRKATKLKERAKKAKYAAARKSSSK